MERSERMARRAGEGEASGATPAEVHVSIVICTRDRCASLQETLDHIGRVVIPEGWQVELVVVDNGSSDATRQVAESFHAPQLDVRYVHEPRKGKGYAYNAGLSAARGRAFLLTDDDVHVPPNWVEGMCRPILDGVAEAVQGGIRIAQHLERPWLKGVLRHWVASIDDPATKPEGLVGANMAFSRKAADTAGPFDHRLGPGASGFFDDTIFGWAIERAGMNVEYRPEVAVEHHFDADRLTFDAFKGIAERMARSRAIVLRQILGDTTRPSILDLLKELPGLAARSVTQAFRWLMGREPDAGFMARYYRVLLWRELRNPASS